MGLGSKFLRSDLNRWHLTQFPNYSRPIGLSPLWPKNKAQGSRFQEWACAIHEGHSWPAAPQEPFFFINGLGPSHLCHGQGHVRGRQQRTSHHVVWPCEALYIHTCAGPWHLCCCSPVIGPRVFTVDPHQTITKCRSLYLPRVMNTSPSLIDSCALTYIFLKMIIKGQTLSNFYFIFVSLLLFMCKYFYLFIIGW